MDIWFGYMESCAFGTRIGLPLDRDCIGINGIARDRALCRFSARGL